MTDTYERVRQVLVELLGLDADKITPQSRLVEDLQADSLDQIEFVLMLEDAFGCPIPDEEIRNVQSSLHDTVQYIEHGFHKVHAPVKPSW